MYFYFLLSSSIVILDTSQARMSQRRTVLVAYFVDFLPGTHSGKCSAKHKLRFQRPNLHIIINCDTKHARYTKIIARLFVGVVVLYLPPSTSASRLRPPFKLKLCHNAPLPTPLSSPAKKATQMGLEPTTFRLEVERAVHCATRSHTQHKKHPRLPGVRGKAFSPKGV